MPDSNLASELNLGASCRVNVRAAAHRRSRVRLRSLADEATYARRKAVVEPVFGVLKQQRGIRQFRTRGMQNVKNEFTLATLALNITRLYLMCRAGNRTSGSTRRRNQNQHRPCKRVNGVFTQTLLAPG